MRDFLQSPNNYFAVIEEAAEDLCENAGITFKGSSDEKAAMENPLANIANHISNTIGLRVLVLPVKVMQNQLRRYDQHRGENLLSEALHRPQRQFHLLVQYASLSQQKILDEICATLGSEDQQTLSLLKVTLAAYVAGTVMMQCDAFIKSAKNLRSDLDLLARRFNTSPEQVCHRLTTLNATHMRGNPSFLCVYIMLAIFQNGWPRLVCNCHA